jgi:steroid 5-alpha reductase family enzyme
MTPIDPLALVFAALVAMTVVMLALWAIHCRFRNASLADVGWCFGLTGLVLWYCWGASGEPERKLLLLLMATVYSARLGFYILFNRIIGKTEDSRYQRLRKEWGGSAAWKMCGYFLLQAPAAVVFSIPFLVVMQNPRPTFSLWELAGILLWAIAVSGEAFADWQLARFRAKPWNRDRVCREGLWRYSRHPNYFFEWLHWWAYVVMGVGTPGWLLTWIGPLVMGVALLKLTGIPLAEAQALATRGHEYRTYQRTTNAFIPWLPKRG